MSCYVLILSENNNPWPFLGLNIVLCIFIIISFLFITFLQTSTMQNKILSQLIVLCPEPSGLIPIYSYLIHRHSWRLNSCSRVLGSPPPPPIWGGLQPDFRISFLGATKKSCIWGDLALLGGSECSKECFGG